MTTQEEISFIESELKIRLPSSYKDFLISKGTDIAFGLPILGLPANYDFSSVLGATALLRTLRPEFNDLLTIRIVDDRMLCLDLSKENLYDAPLVEVDISSPEMPTILQESFISYIDKSEKSKQDVADCLWKIEQLLYKSGRKSYSHVPVINKNQLQSINIDFDTIVPLLKKKGYIDEELRVNRNFEEFDSDFKSQLRKIKITGFEKLEKILQNALKITIPFKARDWRVHRCCVHDLIVGLTAFKYNENFNGIEVNIFLSTEHPDYEQGHGTKALMALILSDAYRNGTSMEVRFTEKNIPLNLIVILKSFEISLSKENEGIITHDESINIFSSLLGIQNDVKNKIKELELLNKITLAGICFLINSRVWTIEQINWLILNAPRARAIVFGRDNPENRINYLESLILGRSVCAFTKLKDKIQNLIDEEVIDIEVNIEGAFYNVTSSNSYSIDWSVNNESLEIETGEKLVVLSRPRAKWVNLEDQIIDDIAEISSKNGRKIILYCNDILNCPNYSSIVRSVNKVHNLFFLIIPFSGEELDEEVINNMKKARTYRA